MLYPKHLPLLTSVSRSYPGFSGRGEWKGRRAQSLQAGVPVGIYSFFPLEALGTIWVCGKGCSHSSLQPPPAKSMETDVECGYIPHLQPSPWKGDKTSSTHFKQKARSLGPCLENSCCPKHNSTANNCQVLSPALTTGSSHSLSQRTALPSRGFLELCFYCRGTIYCLTCTFRKQGSKLS